MGRAVFNQPSQTDPLPLLHGRRERRVRYESRQICDDAVQHPPARFEEASPGRQPNI